ncbi:hypothetical protein DB41_IV00010 [Neochlamydia sp. TUME1]|nr:hypothetical protein [Neochlamydia sp. TUME1]KIC74015.1 hypothetical protein DB41_IV00010 [Neochlamydia sp. TUME1]
MEKYSSTRLDHLKIGSTMSDKITQGMMIVQVVSSDPRAIMITGEALS